MPERDSKLSLDPEACPCAGGTLDKLIQPAILIALSEGPLHGYGLAERLSQMPMLGGQKPDGSGVYRFLKTMERNGLVVSAWDTSQSGPAKKTYRITRAGEGCLRTWVGTLEKYRDGINFLLRAAKKATAK